MDMLKFFGIIALLLFFTKCASSDAQSTAETTSSVSIAPNDLKGNSSILVFIDKTLSVKFDEASTKAWNKQVWTYLQDNYNKNGDKLTIRYVHENTLGAKGEDYVFHVEPLGDLSEFSGKERSEKEDKYKRDFTTQKQNCRKAIKAGLIKNYSSAVSNETDLWATFEIMSRFFNDKSSDNKKVIFFSDMVESKRGKYRKQYDRNRFKSRNDAEAAALADAKYILKEYKINQDALTAIDLSIIFPHGAFDKGDKEYYLYYWENLFDTFGITNVKEGI